MATHGQALDVVSFYYDIVSAAAHGRHMIFRCSVRCPPRCFREAVSNDRFDAQMEVTALPGLARPGIVSNRGSSDWDRATTRCAGEHAMASEVRLEI